jgi:hypothetical protein
MFNGFPSTQTPTVQWWDYSKSNTGTINIALPNDCAPVQFFATGASTTTIQVTLPPNPAQGKTITFKNERYRASTQSIQINDPFPQELQAPCILGQGGSVTFCYIAQNTLKGTGSANWVIISGGSGIAPLNWYAASLSGYQNNSTGGYSLIAGGAQNTSSGLLSFVGSGYLNTASGDYSFVAGGQSNNSTNTNSSVGGGDYNNSTGTSSTIAGGSNGTASNTYTTVGGGRLNTASGISATVGGGFSNNASGQNSAIIGGSDNVANAQSSTVSGASGTSRGIIGNSVRSPSAYPVSTTTGSQQIGTLIVGAITTDATATGLRSDTSAAGTTNQVILPNNSAYYFQGSITSGVTGAGNSAMWSFEGGIKRGANAASTVLVGTPVLNLVARDTGASTWVVALTADTTNGGLRVTVTGQAATTIRWVAKVETTEMTY